MTFLVGELESSNFALQHVENSRILAACARILARWVLDNQFY